MSWENDTFCSIMLRQAKKELREKLGYRTANKLIRENMDVSSAFRRQYTLHWVPDGNVIHVEMWKEKQCSNIDEARAETIYLLLNMLPPKNEYPCFRGIGFAGDTCRDCGKNADCEIHHFRSG